MTWQKFPVLKLDKGIYQKIKKDQTHVFQFNPLVSY